jgi:hypothetical protein
LTPAEPLEIVRIAANALEALRVPYLVGGSLASSLHGIPRSTLDADLVVDLGPHSIAPLAARLKPDFYLDEDAMREAVRMRSCFNVIHLATIFKIDLFLLKNDEFSLNEMKRRKRAGLNEDPEKDLYVASAEDTLLHKLHWFRAGAEVSERQWRDAMGIVRVQGDSLDRGYLTRMAGTMGVKELLDRLLTAGHAGAGME